MSFHRRFAFKAEQNFEKSIGLIVSAALHMNINLRAMYAESISRNVEVAYKHSNIHNFATFDTTIVFHFIYTSSSIIFFFCSNCLSLFTDNHLKVASSKCLRVR